MANGKEPSVKDLGKFILDDFKMYDDVFSNMLACMMGVQGEPLHYVIHDDTLPDDLATE